MTLNGKEILSDSSAVGEGWEINCAESFAKLGDSYDSNGGLNERARVPLNCSPTSMSVTADLVPGEALEVLLIVNITDPDLKGYGNTAVVTKNGVSAPYYSVVNRSEGGGSGSGNVSPTNPTAAAGACVGGAPTAPTVTLPANTAGISYSLSTPPPAEGGTYVVTAALRLGYEFVNPLPTGWVLNGTRATFTSTVAAAPCEEAQPVAPTVTQTDCVGGQQTTPSVTLPANGGGISYTKSGAEVPGGTVTVTATIGNGYAWPDTLPTGWTETSATTATFTVNLDSPECAEEVVPVAPDTTDGSCLGGEYTAPVITPAETDGISYSVSGPDATGAYSVTATLEEGFLFGELPAEWTLNDDGTATFEGMVALNPCEEVVPVDPDTTDGSCLAGDYTAPTITPAETDGIAYTVTGPDATGAYTVTATLEDGFTFGELPEGWVNNEDGTATYEGVVEITPCIETVPVNPTVVDDSCIAGIYTPPTVTAGETDGITYVVTGPDAETGAYTAIATLEDGYTFGELPEGWTDNGDGTATFEGTVEINSCIPVSPVAPSVTESVCVDGVPTLPSVTPGSTDGITYTTTGDVKPGGTVTVIATLSDGFRWSDELPKGWTATSASEATYTLTLAKVDCDKTPITLLPETGAGEGPMVPTTLVLVLAALAAVSVAGALRLRRES